MIEKIVTIDQLPVHYKEYGTWHEQKILILHGWWWSSDSWIQCAELLEQHGFCVVVPDLPGFWKTWLPSTYTLEKYAEIVEQFVQACNLDGCILWGHSNGGAIAIRVSVRDNIRISHLILNNSAGIRNDIRRRMRRCVLSGVARIIKLWLYIFPTSLRKKLRGRMYRAIGSHDALDAQKDPHLLATYKHMISTDLRDQFSHVSCPTHLIWWERDTYTPLRDGHAMHAAMPSARLSVLSGERHGIHLHNPSRLVETFLASHSEDKKEGHLNLRSI